MATGDVHGPRSLYRALGGGWQVRDGNRSCPRPPLRKCGPGRTGETFSVPMARSRRRRGFPDLTPGAPPFVHLIFDPRTARNARPLHPFDAPLRPCSFRPWGCRWPWPPPGPKAGGIRSSAVRGNGCGRSAQGYAQALAHRPLPRQSLPRQAGRLHPRCRAGACSPSFCLRSLLPTPGSSRSVSSSRSPGR